MEKSGLHFKPGVCDNRNFHGDQRRAQYAQARLISPCSNSCWFATEWLFLLLSITLVIAFEIMNSAIENVVDLASNYHFSMLAKNAKDMAAGAVLVVSGFALLTGLVIFVPKFWALVFG